MKSVHSKICVLWCVCPDLSWKQCDRCRLKSVSEVLIQFQGRVMFSDSGDRIARTQIEQMQSKCSAAPLPMSSPLVNDEFWGEVKNGQLRSTIRKGIVSGRKFCEFILHLSDFGIFPEFFIFPFCSLRPLQFLDLSSFRASIIFAFQTANTWWWVSTTQQRKNWSGTTRSSGIRVRVLHRTRRLFVNPCSLWPAG